MQKYWRLILTVWSFAIICSFVELYMFLALPIHVFRNGSFSEGLEYWNTTILMGREIINVSMTSASEQNFPCALTLTGNNTALPVQFVWVKLYQHTAGHPLTKSSSLKASLMVDEASLNRILWNTDAAIIYVGFMASKNNTTKCFMVYAWILCETDSTKITEDTFSQYEYWRIISLEKLDDSLSENPVMLLNRLIWQDLVSQGYPADCDWNLDEGIELGVMLWNSSPSDSPWKITIYLGYLDIIYYWPIHP